MSRRKPRVQYSLDSGNIRNLSMRKLWQFCVEQMINCHWWKKYVSEDFEIERQTFAEELFQLFCRDVEEKYARVMEVRKVRERISNVVNTLNNQRRK